MKIFFDTEFIEDGKTIDLISIGLVREDGHYYYALNNECDYTKASDWVAKNVLPHLTTGPYFTRAEIAADIRKFAGQQPEFWAYYADYDWVALCQLYGRMVDLPDGWPMFCRDVKQLCMDKGNPKMPKDDGIQHHALEDARWAMKAWQLLNAARPEAQAQNSERDRHIEGFRDLNANWDSYGAEKLPEETIQLALRVSKTLSAEWKVIPCADGPSVWFYRGDEDEIIQVWASV